MASPTTRQAAYWEFAIGQLVELLCACDAADLLLEELLEEAERRFLMEVDGPAAGENQLEQLVEVELIEDWAGEGPPGEGSRE